MEVPFEMTGTPLVYPAFRSVYGEREVGMFIVLLG
jgi:hypothetical protein